MPKLPVIVYGSTGFTSAAGTAVCAFTLDAIASAASAAVQVAEWSFMGRTSFVVG
jgi:hypothetical protein